MIVLPLMLVAMNELSPQSALIFNVESAGLLAFVAYWVVKTIELWLIRDDKILGDRDLLQRMGLELSK